MKTIAALLTVHNRKEKTLECLIQLMSQKIPDGFSLQVFLTNDGCTDGTPEAVKDYFPNVKIIDGDGTLFWNRGMYTAWEAAAKEKDFDFYLWLNDDTVLYDDAIVSLTYASKIYDDKSIIVGKTCSSLDSNTITYGGRDSSGKLISNTSITKCSFFNGNIVLIPMEVFIKVGYNDPFFRHSLGDFDYGKRAKKYGVDSYVTANFLGVCDVHSSLPIWCNPNKTLKQRLKSFRSPLGNNPEEFFIYEKRHQGMFTAILHYLTNHLRVFLPELWKK